MNLFGKWPKKNESKKIKNLPIIILAAVLVLALLAGGGLFGYLKVFHKSAGTNTATKINNELTMTNKYLREDDMSQALVYARKALALDPDNTDAIFAVASLVSTDNPEEAKQLYAHAFEIFKKQDNPDVSGKTAVTYWAAAGLAERAGYTDQAKQYYQKVIDTADPSNSYHQNLVKKSEAALKRLAQTP